MVGTRTVRVPQFLRPVKDNRDVASALAEEAVQFITWTPRTISKGDSFGVRPLNHLKPFPIISNGQ